MLGPPHLMTPGQKGCTGPAGVPLLEAWGETGQFLTKGRGEDPRGLMPISPVSPRPKASPKCPCSYLPSPPSVRCPRQTQSLPQPSPTHLPEPASVLPGPGTPASPAPVTL